MLPIHRFFALCLLFELVDVVVVIQTAPRREKTRVTVKKTMLVKLQC
jgi:hypothetical protein